MLYLFETLRTTGLVRFAERLANVRFESLADMTA
jgi:hypothetical protein